MIAFTSHSRSHHDNIDIAITITTTITTTISRM